MSPVPVLKWRDPATGVWHPLLNGAAPEVALPAPGGTHQPSDITITASSRHVEPSPTCRVVMTNPHASKRMLVRATSVVWMAVSANTVGGSLYVDIDCLSGAVAAPPYTPGQTAAETRWDVLSGQNTLTTSILSIDWWVAAGAVATWFVSGAKITGSNLTYKMRGVRLAVTPIRYEEI